MLIAGLLLAAVGVTTTPSIHAECLTAGSLGLRSRMPTWEVFAQLIVPKEVPTSIPSPAPAPSSGAHLLQSPNVTEVTKKVVWGIIQDPKHPMAVVDDKVVSPGYRFPDGTVVESIKPDHVVFKRGDSLIQVRLAGASEGEEIRQFIDEWARSLCEKRLDEHCGCYADKVDAYFTKKNLARQNICHDKAEGLKPYSSFQMQVSNLNIQSVTPSDAVVEFDKSWEAHGAKSFSGSEKQRLKLHRFDGHWKITSEEELQIYWVKK